MLFRSGENLESVGGDHVRMKDPNGGGVYYSPNNYFYHIDHPEGTIPFAVNSKTPMVVKLTKCRDKIWN